MKKTFYPLICLASCVTCLRAELADGVIPSGSTVMQLATLPAGGAGTSDADVVRLAPDGRPTVSANGHIVSLIEERGEPFFEWTPVRQDGGKLVDYCFLDTERIAVLQETRLKIVQNEGCVVNYTLPSRGGRLSRADGHHCYLFGVRLRACFWSEPTAPFRTCSSPRGSRRLPETDVAHSPQWVTQSTSWTPFPSPRPF